MTDPPSDQHSRLWPYLLLYAAAAAWVSFAGIHRWHNSDSLLSSLASLYAWTPFFWQQDRVGLLVPLLTSVCPDPVANLVLQTGLTVFVGLCLPLVLAELVYPHPAARAAVTAVTGLMTALAPDRIRDNLLFECYYPLAMLLGCAALLVLGHAGVNLAPWNWAASKCKISAAGEVSARGRALVLFHFARFRP
ncbi:MAG: hypothetical protein K2P78_01605, partial [Gemmataceae bacterium]|nr:hypothetical protein [Gemmataceae bacterium]